MTRRYHMLMRTAFALSFEKKLKMQIHEKIKIAQRITLLIKNILV